jgi:hypothetical protein
MNEKIIYGDVWKRREKHSSMRITAFSDNSDFQCCFFYEKKMNFSSSHFFISYSTFIQRQYHFKDIEE